MNYLQETETDVGTVIQVYALDDKGFKSKNIAVRLYEYNTEQVIGMKVFKDLDKAYTFADKCYLNQERPIK